MFKKNYSNLYLSADTLNSVQTYIDIFVLIVETRKNLVAPLLNSASKVIN